MLELWATKSCATNMHLEAIMSPRRWVAFVGLAPPQTKLELWAAKSCASNMYLEAVMLPRGVGGVCGFGPIPNKDSIPQIEK